MNNASPTTTAWPDGVIARYLTVGGATVDIRETGPRDAEELQSTVATCTGCGNATRTAWEEGHDYRGQWYLMPRVEAVERAEAAARKWAQKHAEQCRAMQKPGAAR